MQRMSGIISTLSGILVVLIIYCLLPRPPIEPRGILLPAKQRFSALPKHTNVVFYTQLPKNAKLVGNLSAERFYRTVNEKDIHSVLNYAQQLAVQHGGNGIVLQNFLPAGSAQTPKPLWYYLLTGQVIRTE